MSTSQQLGSSDLERLRELNRHLGIVERQLRSLVEERTERPQYRSLAGTSLDLAKKSGYDIDYEKEARLQFVLREDDACYDEDSDNILCEKRVTLTWCHDFLADGADHGPYCDELRKCGAAAAIAPVCYLLYSLLDEGCDANDRRLSISDILRIGSILIDVVTTDQIWISLSGSREPPVS